MIIIIMIIKIIIIIWWSLPCATHVIRKACVVKWVRPDPADSTYTDDTERHGRVSGWACLLMFKAIQPQKQMFQIFFPFEELKLKSQFFHGKRKYEILKSQRVVEAFYILFWGAFWNHLGSFCLPPNPPQGRISRWYTMDMILGSRFFKFL